MEPSIPLSLGQTLAEGAAVLGVQLDGYQRARLLAYLKCLIQWNSVYNLSAIREPRQMLIQHILDSLAIVPVLASHPISSILDVGSGGGLPGVVLAVARPNWHVALNDCVQKKTAFLTHLKNIVPLPNIRVLPGRVESLPSDFLFSAVISRAFSSLYKFVSLSRRLVVPGASIWSMKGVLPEAEISVFEKEALNGVTIAHVIKLNVPFLEAERHLVQIRTSTLERKSTSE